MALNPSYSIDAIWQPRQESVEEVARRLKTLLALLRPIDPLTSKWWYVDAKGACYNYDEYGDRIVDMLNGRVARGDFDEATPAYGFNVRALNMPDVEDRPDAIWIRGSAGGCCVNHIFLSADFQMGPDPRIIRYELFKQALFALDAAFEPDWVTASRSDLDDLTGGRERDRYPRPPMRMSWMIKLPPPVARLVTPPASIISEWTSDGSLFMAATNETFVTSNPEHLARAREIEAVIDPLNYIVPFRSYSLTGGA